MHTTYYTPGAGEQAGRLSRVSEQVKGSGAAVRCSGKAQHSTAKAYAARLLALLALQLCYSQPS
eukprot:COSAG06_NODE_54306_length_295_cov_0.795918_1_plen_63_part_01